MNECKEHKYRVQGEITDVGCPYCRIAELEHDRDGWIRNYEMQEKIVGISQRRISKLEQELADEQKAAGFWMDLSCKDHNRAEKAEQRITQYQSKYNNLLAVAHRDGGRYLAEYGEEKAGEDAITAILTAYHNNDRYQGGIEVEGVLDITTFSNKDFILINKTNNYYHGQRVRVLVMPLESEV